MPGNSSKTTEVAMVVQSGGFGTTPNRLYVAIPMTEADAAPAPTIEQAGEDEFSTGSLFGSESGERLGVASPISGSGNVRAEGIGQILLGMGLGVSGVVYNGDGTATHTLVPVASDTLFPWSALIHHVGSGANLLQRIMTNARLGDLKFQAKANAVLKFSYSGLAGHEQTAAGTERMTYAADPPLTTAAGVFSLLDGGASPIVASAQQAEIVVAHKFPDPADEMALAGHEIGWLTWQGMTVSGSVRAKFEADAFTDTVYGGGSSYSFNDVDGSLTFTSQSAGPIPGSARHWSATVEIPHCRIRSQAFRSTGRQPVYLPLVWKAYKSGSDPLIRVTLTNRLAHIDRSISAGMYAGLGWTYKTVAI